MFLGKQPHCRSVRVILPGEHEVHQKGQEADGQQNLSEISSTLQDGVRQVGRVLHFDRNGFFLTVLFGMNNRARGFLYARGLVPYFADCVADFARILG